MYHLQFRNCELAKVGDLVSKDQSETILQTQLSPSQLYFLIEVVIGIPCKWRFIV